jgi:hypothetical protein
LNLNVFSQQRLNFLVWHNEAIDFGGWLFQRGTLMVCSYLELLIEEQACDSAEYILQVGCGEEPMIKADTKVVNALSCTFFLRHFAL